MPQKLLLLSILLVLVVSTSMYLFVSLYVLAGVEYEFFPPPPYHNQDDVSIAYEYQIALNPKPDWTERRKLMNLWINSMNELYPELALTYTSGIEDVYYQRHPKARSCMKLVAKERRGLKVRYRSYYLGGYSTISLKGDERDHETQVSTCSAPFWPAKKYYNNTHQKCEQDVHPCFSKFARGTTVWFNGYHTNINTCQNLTDIFPSMFKSSSKEPLTHKDGSFWWKYKWDGILGKYTKFDITFTLEYMSIAEALSGTDPMREGEWSLRFSVPHNHIYEHDVVDQFQNMFYSLVETYDVYKKHKVCADLFFAGEESQGVTLVEEME